MKRWAGLLQVRHYSLLQPFESDPSTVDKLRAERGLPALKTLVIDVISHNSAKVDPADAELLKQTKMSSTFIREWIAKRLEGQEASTTA